MVFYIVNGRVMMEALVDGNLIIPKSRIQEVLRKTHASTSEEHFGVMKTLSRTRKQFYWDRLRADVEKWCRDRQVCSVLVRKGPKTEQRRSVTGWAPTQMLFSRTSRSPCDILFGRPSATPSSPNENMNNLEARLESGHGSVRERIKLTSERTKTRYDSRATAHDFE
ncbi:hypothetical protein AVEN_40184-1 [Araneus ventricosus]|uniref:RNA-directed DNA polymerase n=1 Tax=Araneus ventricosus TaxID=182803 RepID=A0A4Y2K1K1_ARAVE|nr:hypothetical protein AVEN_40184-1 [Araneus ventricosus]